MKRPPARGFTLVEVLVAIVVMAIMSLMAWQGVDGIVRTREISGARLEQTLRLETVIAQWEQDLAMLRDSGAVPALTCDGQTVRLTRRTVAGLQVVAWAIRPGTNSAGSWQRWAGPATTTVTALQDSWFATQQMQGGEPGQLRALEGLQQWQVYFWRGNSWSNCQSSGDVANTAAGIAGAPQRLALPTGVRIVLDFAPQPGLAGSLVRDVLLAP